MILVVWFVFIVSAGKCSAMSADELEDFSNFLKITSQLDVDVKSADSNTYDEDEEVADHAWEESGKFEGDLILNDRQRRVIVETVEGLSRNGLTDSTKRWPNNEVIYFIQREHFTGDQVQAIQDGIDDLARASCVKFRPYKKGDQDAVVVQGSRRGCFSQVGYQGGYQVLNLSGRHPAGRGCFRHGTIVHEFLHTLGFYHMQSSPDRDDYIDVKWANIIQPARHNFRKYNLFSVSDFGVGYDYDSVLHYSRRAFSANGQDTLVPKQNGVQIGQRIGLSDKDTQKLNKMYCDADSDNIEKDEITSDVPNKNKKKKPKNLPFDGHGIGYHQGKTVIIKLPAVETIKLTNVPPIDVFDFSKTWQALSSQQKDNDKLGKEVNFFYNPVSPTPIIDMIYSKENSYDTPNDTPSVYTEEQNESPLKHQHSILDTEQQIKERNAEAPVHPKEITNQDIKEALHRLEKSVISNVYPEGSDYFKINTDYSRFYSPSYEDTAKSFIDSLSSDYKKPVSNNNFEPKKQINTDDRNSLNKKSAAYHATDPMDSSYRTWLPVEKPYSAYIQTETPYYATREYLKDRHNYSDIYPSDATYGGENDKKPYTILGDKSTPTEEDWFKNDYYKLNPVNYDQASFTEYVKDKEGIKNMSRKSGNDSNNEERIISGISHNKADKEKYVVPAYETFIHSNDQSSKEHAGEISDEDYDSSSESLHHPYKHYSHYNGNKDNVLAKDDSSRELKQEERTYKIFGALVPSDQNWFKPGYVKSQETSREIENR